MRGLIGAAALVLVLLVGCERAAQPPVVVSAGTDSEASARGDLVEYRPVPEFSFRAPRNLDLDPRQAIDSAAGAYTGAGITVAYDYGPFADPLTNVTDPIVSRQHLVVEGVAATLVESERWAAIHFPAVDGNARLTVTVHWEVSEGRSAGLALLRTVRFR